MSVKIPGVSICTLGCKVNQYESEAIAEAFAAAGFAVIPQGMDADVYIINTCTVTAESDRKGRQLIRRIIAAHPKARVLVTGCTAQAKPHEIAAIKGVDAVCGNAEKLAVVKKAAELLKTEKIGLSAGAAVAVSDMENAAFEPMKIKHFERTRAYLKIEDGCENRCTYCAIPAARGKVRSKPPMEVLEEVEALTRGGCREIVLTGIETASYGKDLEGASLIDLLEQVDAIKGVGRIRLGSLDPSIMKAPFLERLAPLTSLAPHFHLSMQSGSSKVLAAMKRKYNREMALKGVKCLRSLIPHVELTADFIVGFPGESDEDFADTVEMVKEAAFLQIHVFPFSGRAGTPAAAMKGQIPAAVKKERAAALIALGEEIREQRLERALKTAPICSVLFETYEGGKALGHTSNFLEVAVKSSENLHAQTHDVRLLSREGGKLLGVLAEP